jgi:diguanylate cyclase (GGDEF)-like protein/PAS domain S-box-containing protein
MEFARNVREGIYITARDGRILDANPAFLEMFGVASLVELTEYSAADLVVDPSQRAAEVEAVTRDGSVREFELTIRRPDGEVRTVLDTCYLAHDAETGEDFFHGILVDITSRKELEARLLEMSTHDPLTGALNRRYLIEIEEMFARDAAAAFGCIFIDIDNFKQYNDQYGHQRGDEVLVKLARFLLRYVRAEEAVVRIGGDEFVVMLKGADASQTSAVAERLRSAALEGAPVPFSLGWASREPGETLPRMLDRADRSLLAVRVLRRQTDPRQQPGHG